MSNWIETYTHEKVDIFDPNPDTICIEDIAHHLALICRFAGAIREHYSVAQHSIILASLFEDKTQQLQALMHDAAEYVLTDIPAPVKNGFGYGIKYRESEFLKVIFDKFDIEYPYDKTIDLMDKRLCYEEAKQLGKRVEVWGSYTPEKVGALPKKMEIVSWNWRQSKAVFLYNFNKLKDR